jgi:hypothetical protein
MQLLSKIDRNKFKINVKIICQDKNKGIYVFSNRVMTVKIMLTPHKREK